MVEKALIVGVGDLTSRLVADQVRGGPLIVARDGDFTVPGLTGDNAYFFSKYERHGLKESTVVARWVKADRLNANPVAMEAAKVVYTEVSDAASVAAGTLHIHFEPRLEYGHLELLSVADADMKGGVIRFKPGRGFSVPLPVVVTHIVGGYR
jgi:hypothetical protein